MRGGRARPGEWRTIQNFVANSKTGEIIYTPPAAADVPALMRELVEWLRNEQAIHPVLVAGIAQFQLVHIHPFVDGNGRTSRLLSTLCLYRAGYDFKRLFTISEYYDRDRAAFYAALQGVRQADMALTGWLEFFVAGLSTQLQEVKTRGEQATRADVLATSKNLNPRQATLVTAFLEHTALSLADCEKLLPNVARRTVQRDLKRLVEVGLVAEMGQGPTDPTRSYRWLGVEL
ncbi:MAG: Fic family protein [Deltaproteobacteria bacterium]